MVPIVSSVQAGHAIDFDMLPLEDHEVVPSLCPDPKSFALTVRGISMEPRYSEDDVIIVSPAKEKRYESLVVAQLAGVGATFKILNVPSAKGMIRLSAYNPGVCRYRTAGGRFRLALRCAFRDPIRTRLTYENLLAFHHREPGRHAPF